MKEFLLSVVFFMLMPTAFADIAITADQNVYNLGDRIKASASILRNEDFEGFFKLSILCGSYNLQYFLTPVTLEANFRTAANVPELAATASMLGNCAISGQLLTNSNQIVEEKTSSSFEVTNKLTVLPVNSKITAVPGDSILVAGIVNEAFGANVLKASAKIALDNYSHAIEAVDGKFNLVVDLPKNIRSGKHKIEITASDPKLNLGENSIELDITAIPSYIKLDISDRQLLPGSKIEIITSLYDQADDLINSSLNLELKSPSGNNVFIKVAQSSEKIGYEFSQYAEPGIYVLSSAYKNLPAEGKINITPVREVRIKYENETVFVENTGNVLFEDELTFLIESELKKYPITKKIRVEPSKTLAVDLSREVPLGTYSIKVPIKEGLEPVSKRVSEIIQNAVESTQANITNLLSEKTNVLANGVMIHDNRPVYKKMLSGLTSIRSNLVGSDGLLSGNPLIAPAVLGIIFLLIVFRYGRKPIMRLVRRKKNDEKEEQLKLK